MTNEIMMNERNRMVAEIVEKGSMEYASERIREWCVDLICRYIDDLDTDELMELLGDTVNIHKMEDLDSEFSSLTATEVLEELADIDLSDDYFCPNRYGEVISGNDVWDLAGIEECDFAEQLFNEELFWNDSKLDDIRNQYDQILEEVKEKMAVYKRARNLFDLAMDRDPSAVISMLWNINQ